MSKNTTKGGQQRPSPQHVQPLDLDASLPFLQRAIEDSPLVVLITDRSGRIEYVNPAVESVAGYRREEVIGQTPAIFRSEQTADEVFKAMWETILAGENWCGEILNRKKNGDPVWISLSISPLRSDDGEITHFVGIQEDITERKLVETTIHASEQRFRDLIEAMPSGVVIADMEQRLSLVNHAFCEIVGIPREQATGMDLRRIVHPEDLATLERETRRRSRGHSGSYDLRILRGDGEIREVKMSASPLVGNDGTIREAVGILVDVTEERRLEARVRALARFPEQNPNPVIRVATGGEVLFTNAAGKDLSPLFDSGSFQRVRPEWRSRLDEVYRSGRQQAIEIEAGSRYFFTTICPSLGEGYVTLYGLDITATHRAMDEASRAREQALEASRVKSEFLANMSHELRTPLNGVLGLAELLSTTQLDDEQRQYVDDLLLSGRRLFDLIGEVLDFSRIELGRLELESVEFDVADLLEECRRMHAPLAAKLGLELRFSLDCPKRRRLRGDPKRIRQILDNLLSNALRFTPEGTVSVEARCDAAETDSSVLTIVVSDTGIGIPADQVETIFDSFTQVDGSATRSYEGSGLGLAICAALAREFGGDIQVSSEVGRGSRFTVVLPLATVDHGAAAESPGEPSTGGDALPAKSLRILLAEDNRVNQIVAQRILEKQGHTVVVVADGKQAIDALEQDTFDVALMDIQMPVLDGISATQRIRQTEDPRGPRLPIIALTAHAVDRDRARCLAAGMDDYLSKPIRTRDLLRALARIAARSADRHPAPQAP